ncbi:hypothetical protein PFISCL1PPCAC_2434 [Pristionchus fissidentatus]|uniref:Uncharacterized protein n=1 Tax=Pristionchus fissidentatus TaxID=1538716 RepID=A0AAV5UV35_9BILA|nr:hypothetical protein PFISCL1PPCAC_2434 [Pristionchus fissidentatus]
MDLFANFELDEVEQKEQLRWITPEEYRAEDNSDGWFMREEQNKLVDRRELLSHRASHLNRLGRHEEALEIYDRLKSEYGHRGGFRFMAEDSCLSTALMIPSFPSTSLIAMLDTLRPTVMNYGDQLQYFSLCSKLYYRSGDWPLFLRSLIFLSSYLDMTDHWEEMAKLPVELQGPNFGVGCWMKTDLLLSFQLGMSRGFVTRKLERDQGRIRRELAEWSNRDQVERARREMDTTVVKGAANDDLSRPAHLCRWSEGSLLTLSSSLSVLDSFIANYSWLLEGMDAICMQMRAIDSL